jgi:hypothetical protein
MYSHRENSRLPFQGAGGREQKKIQNTRGSTNCSTRNTLVCGGQPSPHKPRLVVSHSTCPLLSSSPHAHSFVFGTAVINTQKPYCANHHSTQQLVSGNLLLVVFTINMPQHGVIILCASLIYIDSLLMHNSHFTAPVDTSASAPSLC